MNKYIVEVPEGAEYREVEVEADEVGVDPETGHLFFTRGEDPVAAFRDWITFRRTEADVEKSEIKVTVNGTPLVDDLVKALRYELSRSGRHDKEA